MPISIHKWDIVLLNYPFTDSSITKVRPGVIIGVVLNDLGREDAIIAAITSKEGYRGIQIKSSHPEFPQSGLKKNSRILPAKIFTCAKTIIHKKIGTLGSTLQGNVETQLRRILNL